MEKIVNMIAGMGVPGIMLMVAISMTGMTGAVAITTALGMLGPGGMVGGIITLTAAGAIASALSDYGIDALFKAVIKKMYAKGETKESIKKKIEKGLWSKKVKAMAVSYLEKL